MRFRRILPLLFLALAPSASAQTVTTPAQTAIACAYNTTIPSLTAATYGLVQCDAAGRLILSSTVGAGSTPVPSTTLESSHVLKASAGSLLSLSATTTTVAGWVMVFNATSAPVDGAVTPIYAWQVPANGVLTMSWPVPAAFSTGITVAFSSTGPTTKTASATAFFTGQVQ
jgi:hypothetical protein